MHNHSNLFFFFIHSNLFLRQLYKRGYYLLYALLQIQTMRQKRRDGGEWDGARKGE